MLYGTAYGKEQLIVVKRLLNKIVSAFLYGIYRQGDGTESGYEHDDLVRASV